MPPEDAVLRSFRSSERSFPSHLRRVHERGAFKVFEPTHIEFRSDGIVYVWESRRHRIERRQRYHQGEEEERRDLEAPVRFFAWQPRSFSYWTALSFFMGSVFFVVAGILSVLPPAHLPADASMYFLYMTSIPSLVGASMFLAGASAQYLAVINGVREVDLEKAWSVKHEPGEQENREVLRAEAKATMHLVGWQPTRLEFWAAVVIWIGSLLFEVNSVLLVIPPVYDSVALARRYIWSFSTAGSSLFIVGGYLQFVEDAHAFWAWRPRHVGFWATLFGMLGGVFFTVASVLGFWNHKMAIASYGVDVALLIGALCFLVSSYCLILERVNP